ncbi:MAG: MBL fold metallo-hydrolase [Bacilli bacterium]|nr:MBL fold metallo-hydrolase [Bacilli bacterium]
MKKIILAIIFFIIPIQIYGLELTSKGGVAYNIEEEKYIYEQNKDEIYEIGDLTNIITSLVSLNKISNLDKSIVVDETLYDLSNTYYKNGDVITYKDLLHNLILTNDTDTIKILTNALFNNTTNLVEEMNNLINQLELKNTTVNNVFNITSSLDDMVIIMKHVLSKETLKEIYSNKEYLTSDNKIIKTSLYDFYDQLKYIKGSKLSNKKNYSLVSIASNEKSTYIVITIDAENMENLIKDTSNIYNYVFENFDYIKLIDKDKIITNIKVKYSKEKNIDIKLEEDYKIFYNKDLDINKLKYEYISEKEEVTHFTKNIKIGTYKIYYNDELLEEVNVTYNAKTTLDKMLLLETYYYIPLILLALIVIDIILLLILNNKKTIMYIETLKVGYLKANCYILTIKNKCLIIDPGAEYKKIMEHIKNYQLLGILVTHEHADHVGCVKQIIKAKKCKLFYKSNLNERTYNIGPFKFECIYTPGHTNDSVTYYFKDADIMFTGDFIFKGSIGRYDLLDSNIKDMKNSINEIIKYKGKTALYPGHGQKTTLEEEIKNNEYIKGEL